MTASINIVKRSGKRPTETYSTAKLHASIIAACLSVRTPGGEADTIATRVCKAVDDWCDTKSEVTSNDIRRIAAKALETYHPEAAYLYRHHRLVL